MSLLRDGFPRSNQYNPEWMVAGASGGANALWLAEWLSSAMDLRPGMRVLDLGCGRAMSSIFFHREFGVQVWAADLWFSASENLQRVRDARVDGGVFPIQAEARALPFATDFFDAIVSIDSFPYYGTDSHYLNYLARFLKPGGAIGIAGAGFEREFDEVPDALKPWWEPGMWCLHSAEWWRRHWERTGIVDVDVADSMPDAWKLWIQWQEAVSPENHVEMNAIKADAGKNVGYVRVVGRRRVDAKLEEPLTSMSIRMEYVQRPLLRE